MVKAKLDCTPSEGIVAFIYFDYRRLEGPSQNPKFVKLVKDYYKGLLGELESITLEMVVDCVFIVINANLVWAALAR